MADAKAEDTGSAFDLSAPTPTEWEDRARLFFNYLRLSPGYWLAHNYPQGRRIPRAMSLVHKQFLASHERYGDVYGQTFIEWMQGRENLFKPRVTQSPRVLTGKQHYRVDAEDLLIHISAGSNIPSSQTLAALLAPYSSERASNTAANGRCNIRLKSLWKMLYLAYVRLTNPDIELWRVGVLAKTVDRFGATLDPWGPRSLAKDSMKRRHLTLIVHRLLERGCLVAENAASGEFPRDTHREGMQLRFDFENLEYVRRLQTLGEFELANAQKRIRQLAK